MDSIDSAAKPYYCHWDSHEQDVFFTNEDELDQHLYSHFQKPSTKDDFLVDSTNVTSKQMKNVECHWDTCHEMFDIDEIMEHFRSSHQEVSVHPHHGNCASEITQCLTKEEPPSEQSTDSMRAYVRLNSNTIPNDLASSRSFENPTMAAEPQVHLDSASLPTLDTPESLPLECHRCMWCTQDGHICGVEYMTSTELNAHIVHTHVIVDSKVCEWTGCDREREPFCQRQKLVRHLQTHVRALDYKCKYCSKALCSDSQLKLHERHHTQEKPFSCEVCNKAFKSRNSLMVHTRTHTGAKPLCCPYPGCGKRFSESSNLAKHRRTHEKPQFECPECHRMFTRKDHLARHMNCKKHFHSHNKHESHHISDTKKFLNGIRPPKQSQYMSAQQFPQQRTHAMLYSSPHAQLSLHPTLTVGSQFHHPMPVVNTQPHSQAIATPLHRSQPKAFSNIPNQGYQYPAMPCFGHFSANMPSNLIPTPAQQVTPPHFIPSQSTASATYTQ